MEKQAKKSNKPNKPLYIVLAIFISCALWFYVRSVDTQDRIQTITNIPVTFVGEDVLNSNGLMLMNEADQTVSLTVQGRWSIISQLRRDNIAIQVDLSRILTEGEYSRAYDIIWPGNLSTSSFALMERDPFYVPVSVARRVTQEVEIKGVFQGSVADGYEAGDFSFQPETLSITGPEEAVARVHHAQVILNREGLTDTVREEVEYVLIGHDGAVIEDETIKTALPTVTVTLPVTVTRELPLSVDFIPGGGITGESDLRLVWSIEPKTITLKGSESDLAAYGQSISVATIDLSKTSLPLDKEFTIPLGDEVESVTGITKVRVNVDAKGLEVREFSTGNIELVNIPTGVSASLVTRSLTVRVRGTAEALDQIMPQQHLQVRVDLADMSSRPDGQSTAEATVNLLGVEGAGVVGEGYTVSIRTTGAGQIGGNS